MEREPFELASASEGESEEDGKHFFRFLLRPRHVKPNQKKTQNYFPKKLNNKKFQVSNADIAAICQEAGMHAVRKNRYVILPKDFEKGYKANVKKSDSDFAFYT